MRSANSESPNFLDKKDPRFKLLHNTLDTLFHNLHSEGIGRQTKHAEVISLEEEEKLWKSQVMNLERPRGLLNAAFYIAGKMFCLRGGQEHRELRLTQLERLESMYTMKMCQKTETVHLNSYVLRVKLYPCTHHLS